MAAAAAGIFNQYLTQGQGVTAKAASMVGNASARPSDTSGTSGSGSTSSGDSSTISANDFLTLLVTEMQNQDPTADTDPNEYINQLVQVNSLEQLIDINNTLTADSTGTGAAASASGANPSAAAVQSSTAAAAQSAAALGNASPTPATVGSTPSAFSPAQSSPQAASAQPSAQPAAASQSAAIQYAPGNLTGQPARPAAAGVAHALDGRWRAHR